MTGSNTAHKICHRRLLLHRTTKTFPSKRRPLLQPAILQGEKSCDARDSCCFMYLCQWLGRFILHLAKGSTKKSAAKYKMPHIARANDGKLQLAIYVGRGVKRMLTRSWEGDKCQTGNGQKCRNSASSRNRTPLLIQHVAGELLTVQCHGKLWGQQLLGFKDSARKQRISLFLWGVRFSQWYPFSPFRNTPETLPWWVPCCYSSRELAGCLGSNV